MDCDGLVFNLEDYLPSPLLVSTTSEDPTPKAKKTYNKYRPTKERPTLEYRLFKWLEHEHSIDFLRSTRHPSLILSHNQRLTLIRTHPSKITTPKSITTILDQSPEWAEEWAEKIFSVIAKFNEDIKVHNTIAK